MNVEKQENGNLVFNNENESFTFVDMGNYVGYQSRQWYEEAPNCWRLMFYDEKKEDSPIHIEALVDSTGCYSRIMVCQGNNKRVLLLNGNVVDEDMIFEMDKENSIFPKKTYIAFEDAYREKKHPDVQAYLSQEHQFISSTGEAYTGNISSDNYINNFLVSNMQLSKLIDDQTNVRHR